MIARHSHTASALPRIFAELINPPSYGTLIVRNVARTSPTAPDGSPRPANIPDILVTLYSEAHEVTILTDIKNVRFILNDRAFAAGKEILEELYTSILAELSVLELFLAVGLLSTSDLDNIKAEHRKDTPELLVVETAHAMHRIHQHVTERRYDPSETQPFLEVRDHRHEAKTALDLAIDEAMAYLLRVGQTRH